MVEWLGRWTCNLEVPGSSPSLTTSWCCFTVVPSLTPRPRFQLVCLLPVGILNVLCNIFEILVSV